jgi:hypothetical protein
MRIGVTGHQDIPSEALPFVTNEITKVITGAGDGVIGVSSLAVGADQLFASLILKYGGQLEVILPSRHYEHTFSQGADLKRFRWLLKKAASVKTLDFPEPYEEAFLMAGRRVVETAELLLAIWDGEPARGKGGTADTVSYAHKRGTNVQIIWPSGLTRD